MEKMHIQFTLFSAFYSPLISTMSGGFLKQEGIDASYSVAPAGVSAIKALEEGTAQVIQSAPSQGFTSLGNGETPTAVHFAQINEMDGFFLTAREGDAAAVHGILGEALVFCVRTDGDFVEEEAVGGEVEDAGGEGLPDF